MNLTDRIEAFVKLGNCIDQLDEEAWQHIYLKTATYNNWFTPENTRFALDNIRNLLFRENLEKWMSAYHFKEKASRKVGVVMAGNIPAVGFHDFLSVLISGHELQMKLSHQDPFLLDYFSNMLISINPEFKNRIFIVEQLKNMQAIIATGSDNASRYFEYYFKKWPHIIRKNRTSCAILTGSETSEMMLALGKDIFQYYGLGCRNVSKLFVPEHYDFEPLFNSLEAYQPVFHHHKYRNNYDYNKSIYLVNKAPHLDTGFVLLRESNEIVSPIACLYFQYYQNKSQLESYIRENQHKIQCVVSDTEIWSQNIPFGMAQHPILQDYADNIDTLRFLEKLA